MFSTYTRPNTSIPWHTETITDPYLNTLQEEVVEFRWTFHGQKAVNRVYTDTVLTVEFIWYQEETYNTYHANPKVLEYEPLLISYYESFGGTAVDEITTLTV